jgi:hypothetical protein
MDQRVVAVIAILAIIVVLVGIWVAVRRKRAQALRRRFGPEYDRIARRHGAKRANTILLNRERRVERLPLRRLSVEERDRFAGEWHVIQATFVDDPAGAATEADLLVGRLMQARGYPLGDFDQRAADISVDHPRVVDNYRAAHEISLRHRAGEASTEDLRNSVIYYRSLFEELLGMTPVADQTEIPRKEVA